MERAYYLIGFGVVWGGAIFATLAILYFIAVVVAGLWQRFEYSQYGNLWFAVKDLAHYLQTGRARWQPLLTHRVTREMLQGWNNRNSHMCRFRRIATYRRQLLAWMVRRQRANHLIGWPH